MFLLLFTPNLPEFAVYFCDLFLTDFKICKKSMNQKCKITLSTVLININTNNIINIQIEY